MDNLDSENLWIRFKNGDLDALAKLFKRYADDLYSYGLKIVNDESLVKDCLQEVFIQVINKRKVIKVTSTTHVYLFKTLRNKLLEELRSSNRKQIILSNLAVNDTDISRSAEHKYIQNEERLNIQRKLNRALEELTDRQKEIIYLKYSKGFNHAEIAELLQIDQPSVRKLLYRALMNLRGKIKTHSIVLVSILLKTTASQCVDNKSVGIFIEKS